jgi:hypothetical protein
VGVYITEDGILHCHRRENLKSYKYQYHKELVANDFGEQLAILQVYVAHGYHTYSSTVEVRSSRLLSVSILHEITPLINLPNLVRFKVFTALTMKMASSGMKRRFLQEPHGVTSQKMPFFTVYLIFQATLLPWGRLSLW